MDRVLALITDTRDEDLVRDATGQNNFETVFCRDIEDLLARLEEGAGAGILGEQWLTAQAKEALGTWASKQPSWSDFPFIVLTGDKGAAPEVQALGNAILLERPVPGVLLGSILNLVLRARCRQYETQTVIADRQQAEALVARQADDLVRSNADLQQFAYVTSHDLQEPLRTIHSYSQLVQRRYAGKLDADAEEYLGFITGGARRMQRMIEDLLAYSRLVNQEQRQFGRVSMNAVVQWTLSNLQSLITDGQTSIAAGDLPVVRGDQIKLVQLMQNLLSNAIKFRRPDASLQIGITAEPFDEEWLFRVSDNGQGIASEYHQRIFGLFKRLHGKDVPGTGIGLALCRKIVEQHAGRLWVESAAGAGSTFCFTLPAAA